MLFDLSTIYNTYITLAKFLKIDYETLRKLLDQYHIEKSINHFKTKLPKDAETITKKSRIKFFHITTTIDNLASIKERGILTLDKLLSTESSFTNFLKEHNIEYIENQQIFLVEGQELDIKNESWTNVVERLTDDSIINGFYYMDDSMKNYSSVISYPEILHDLDEILNNKYKLKDKWKNLATPYVLEIEIPWIDGEGDNLGEEIDADEFFKRLVKRAAGEEQRNEDNIFFVKKGRNISPKEIKNYKKLI
ncbi:Uncharacterised protein [Listeria grayi]|uniref:Uncharacterized protein n=1 Tax=Listeria grayi FSL F6-1183 TaxID=1265827 RepID=A0A829R9R5_LISGR|nr:hypothetical protein [Listeria grayi]EUJ29888.1 hypothetical protein LMUR_02267 [Listeria grayi FSL F6-1183]VEI34231.1 Uncharacterised protein [Listeria grayi]